MYRDLIFRPILMALVWGALVPAVHAGDVVLIGHPAVPHLDHVIVERIFTGKVVEVGGIRVTPIDMPVGDAVRNRFLVRWLGKSEERYTAYWTVRRYVGKGVPPLEAANTAEVIRLVATRPGSIGYIDEAELKAGMNVVAR